MSATPISYIRLPLHLKKAIYERTDNLSQFVIQAVTEKLEHEPEKTQQKEKGGNAT